MSCKQQFCVWSSNTLALCKKKQNNTANSPVWYLFWRQLLKIAQTHCKQRYKSFASLRARVARTCDISNALWLRLCKHMQAHLKETASWCISDLVDFAIKRRKRVAKKTARVWVSFCSLRLLVLVFLWCKWKTLKNYFSVQKPDSDKRVYQCLTI